MQNNRQSEAKKLDNCVATAVNKKNVNQTSSSSSLMSTAVIQSSSNNRNNNCGGTSSANKQSAGSNNNKNSGNSVLTQQNNSNNKNNNSAKSKSNAAAATSQIIAGGTGTGSGNAQASSPQNSTPTKSDTETYSEFQRRVTDSSDSDEESVSEVDSFPIDQESIEMPESCSDSCENEESEGENNNYEDEDGDESEGSGESGEESGDDAETDQTPQDTKARLTALLEAADEAAQALTRMRGDNRDNKHVLSRSLLAACSDNDMTTVRKLLGENNGMNDGTDDGDSLLSLACSAGYYELAQVLLAMSAQVEDRGQKNDCTPLMEAASAGHIDIIELLLKHGADVNAQSSTGNTPLMYACAGGHVDAVKLLLAAGANVEDHNENGHTPLMEAASAGHVSVAKILLEHGAGINTHSNEFKESALTLACYKGHLDMVRFLLGAGADQEHKTDEMHTALMEASMDGHVEVARLLLDSGAQVNMPTDSFESPLTLAACGGHVDLAMLLIERGANIEEVNDEGYTPLMEAAREGHEEMVALLLSQGANINAQTEETQETALTLACCGGFLEVTDYLIKHGADIELGASTPLMEAAQEGHIELVRFLLENRANVHAQTQTGDTALAYACENGHTDVAEILLMYGAELEHESEGGRTPLMKACRAGHLCTVKFLLGRGADVNRQTANNDHTPLSLACAGGHQAVVELLLANGADPFHKLKDNSTMLIEAAKGGHINVVQLLFDFPQSLAGAQSNMLVNNGLQQIAPIPLKHQHNLLQVAAQAPNATQMMQTPPGLHDVPEAIRTSNQFAHQLQAKDFLDQSQIISYNEYIKNNPNALLDANSALAAAAAMGNTPGQQESSIIAQMRLLQIQNEGFKDGLMQGLAKAQPGLLNNNNNNNANRGAQQLVMPPQMQQSTQTNVAAAQTGTGAATTTTTTTGKQKSVLRKNRQQIANNANANAAHYQEQDLTLSEAQQVRSQPIGADGNENLTDMASILNHFDAMNHDEFMQKWKESLSFYNDGPPPTLLPPPSNAYIDPNATQAQGSIYGTHGGGFNFSAPSLHATTTQDPFLQSQPVVASCVPDAKMLLTANTDATSNASLDINNTLATFFTDARQSGQENAFAIAASGLAAQQDANKKQNGQTIKGPADVSQNTAIADRPKVKPVSKKDGKYIKKYIPEAQQLQNIKLCGLNEKMQKHFGFPPASGANVASSNNAQDCLSAALSSINFITSGATNAGSAGTKQSNILQAATNIVPNPLQASNNQVTTTTSTTTTASSSASSQIDVNTTTSTSSSSAANENLTNQQQLTQQLTQIHPWNPKMLQKIAQRLIVDPSGSNAASGETSSENREGSPSGSSSDESGAEGMSPPLLNVKQNSNIQLNLELSDVDLAAISSTFCSQLAQVHQHVSNIIQQKPGNKNDQEHDFIDTDVDGNMQIFRIDDTDADMSGEGVEGLYPPLGDSFNVSDVSFENDNSQNLEWVDCFDEVLTALNIPGALQEIAANCSDIDTYANLFGMNTYCKARWAEQWPPTQQQKQQQQAIIDEQCAAVECPEHNDDDERHQHAAETNQLIALDHQQLQQELSLQHLQLFNQLQNQEQQPGTLPLIPVTIDQQASQNVVLQAMQNQALQQQIAAADAQQQAKFVFNVETDKSLQLLFQLPTVGQQQGGQAQPPQGAILTQPQTDDASQTQTTHVPALQQQQQQTQDDGTAQALQVLQSIQDTQCNQHQVATQTPPSQTTNNILQGMPPLVPRSMMQNQQQQQPDGVKTITQKASSTKKTEKRRLIDKRFEPRLQPRPKPAGQTSTANVPATPGFHYTDQNVAATGIPAQHPINGAPVMPPDRTIDVDSETDSNHDTALTLACAGGHEELVELLLERGANIEHRDKKGFTPLILASTAGHAKVVEILINRKAELEAQSERTKDTPLSLACSGGRYEVVELLLKHGANKEHRNVSDYTPLSLAASGGYVNIIKMLLNNGAEINSRTGSKLGISPLMLAAMNGHTPAVRLLLDMGSDINAQIETNRNTALTLACFQGRHEVVSLLLDRKANVEHRAKTGLTPLMEAASGGYIEVGRVLLDKGADVNAAPVPSSRDTALTIAADKGHLKFVELLLMRNAAVEVKNKKGNSPLWLAANGGHLGVVELLCNANADIDSQDNRKVSCLMAAFRKGHTKVVKWMVNHVSQFPSDQEMTRFISTISDKDILDKCHECVKVIRAAKETQAKKAYMNASILLRELDMEKNREEQKKAAAAKRRERKKRRKQEKREQQRKLSDDKPGAKNKNQKKGKQEELEEDSEASDSSDSDDDDDEEILETIPEPTPMPATTTHKSTTTTHHQAELRHEKEEGDSGIDANSQGSCSSSDVKASAVLDKTNSKQRNKKKKQQNQPPPVNTSGSNSNRSSNSPATIISNATTTTAVTTTVTSSASSSHENESQSREFSSKSMANNRREQRKATNAATQQESTKNRAKEKENVAPKQEEKTKSDVAAAKDQQKSSSKTYEHYQQPINQRKNVYSNSRHTVERDDYEVTENVFYNSNTKQSKLSKESPGKQTSASATSVSSTAVRREEGWKEVVSKSSSTRSLPLELKKVQVPTHAISRVIGRAGSNINAIRAATGAHIEVEKQGKVQGDRSITIKGTNEATKQAYHLITTLIRDPDVDILQVLKKEGIGKVVTHGSSGQHITISTWDSKSSKPGSTTSSQDGDAFPSKKGSTKNVAQNATSNAPSKTSQSSGRSSTAKNLFAASTSTAATTTSSKTVVSSSSASTSVRSTTVSKSVTSYSGTISSSSASVKAPAATFNKSQAPATSQTFAARVSSVTSDTKKVIGDKVVQPTKVLTSPKHALPAPFTSSGNILTNSGANPASGTKPVFTQSTSEPAAVSTTVRSVTPIGPPHRNNTPTSNLTNPATSGPQNPIGTPIQGSKMISGNLQAQAHEYSLFNDNSYGGQWDNNQYTASMKAKQITETQAHETPSQKVDVSKAPGYRGNALSSPVSSSGKASSQSTTPPSTNILPAGVIGSQMPSQQQQFYAQQQNEAMSSNVIKAPSQPQPIQRPLSGVNNMKQMPPAGMESYSLAPGPPPSMTQQQQPPVRPDVRGNMFDTFQQPSPSQHQQANFYSQDSYSNSGLGPIGMSRLNPKANAFNSMPQGGNAFQSGNKGPGNYGGMYGNGNANNNYASQKQMQNMNTNPYQNRAPGAPPNAQSGQLNGAGMRWGYPDLGYAPSARDMMGLENGMSQMGMNSPSMSPNSAPNGMPNVNAQSQMDEQRKTRPIGAERLWKYNTFGTGGPLELDNNVGLGAQGPPQGWGIDKPPQNQMPLQWIQSQPPIGRGAFGDELVHGNEAFQPLQVDYQNLMGGNGPNQNLNYMYAPFMGNDPMVTEPTWEHDKNTWTKWSH
ncbi:ankyrin repeat and KH domain-containing protein mask-like isoform X2 [Culicoides brevitarsis]|uniref:ankyrin repeat and KH domain-containing protein mask-like isoform X2 n=1 Tax=Culicoides brevitarsis TaxID=469753 RepID=UPI00307C0505